MARITVEDCLNKQTNRFALVLLAAKRTKQLLLGAKPVLKEVKNKPVVNALREIANGSVRFMSDEDMERVAELEAKRREERLAEVAASTTAAADALFHSPPKIADDDDGDGDDEVIDADSLFRTPSESADKDEE